jgi:hypothetical protein
MINESKLAPTTYVVLALLILIGFWLRIRCLDCLGFHGDEDLTSLAVKALSSKGVPELPSGMIYLRFYPYQWLLALSTGSLGFGEFSMRLPAVLFGTVLIPVAFVFARQLTTDRIALLVALGIALSFWQVDMSRLARMYAPFFLLFALAAIAIYRSHFMDTDRLWSPLALLLSFSALTIHQLGYSLAVLYLVAIPLNPNLRRSTALLLQAGFIGMSFVLIKKFQESYFYRPIEVNSAAAIQPESKGGGVIGLLLEQISLPDISLASSTVLSSYPIAFVYGAVAIFLLVWIWRNTATLEIWPRIAGQLGVFFAAFHQFNLSIVLLAVMIALSSSGIRVIRANEWRLFAAAVAVFLVFWGAVVVAMVNQVVEAPELAGLGTRKLFRMLVDYPNFRLFWSFVLERPLLGVPLAAGTLWCLDRLSRRPPEPAALFLVGGFWGILFMNSILETKFEFFRYNLHLDVFYITLVVLGVVSLPRLWLRLTASDTGYDSVPRTAWRWYAAACALVIVGVRAESAWLTSSKDYVETEWPYTELGLNYHPDFRSPAEYVAERLSPDDRIFVFDPREYWNYLGHVDYWIYSDNYQSQTYFDGVTHRDLYLGVPVLSELNHLREALAQTNSGTNWIIYSRRRLERTPWVSEDIKDFISSLDDQVVHTARDRATVVIRLHREGESTE